MQTPKILLAVFLSFGLVLGATKATQAMQIKEALSDGEVSAFIAADELSRIKVINDRIKSVKSNEGDLEIIEDANLGELYLRPVKRNLEPVNIFITTEKNHIYKLLLLPKKTPSEQIFIKNLEVALESVKLEIKNPNKNEAAIALIKAMRDANTTYNKKSTFPKLKANGHELTKKFVLINNKIRGEAAEYLNKKKLPVVITSETFLEQGIIAVSSDSEVLEPNQSTNIYIVREVSDE
jgi:conjugal transfer pilus assembly protein TraK